MRSSRNPLCVPPLRGCAKLHLAMSSEEAALSETKSKVQVLLDEARERTNEGAPRKLQVPEKLRYTLNP